MFADGIGLLTKGGLKDCSVAGHLLLVPNGFIDRLVAGDLFGFIDRLVHGAVARLALDLARCVARRRLASVRGATAVVTAPAIAASLSGARHGDGRKRGQSQ